MNQSVLVKTNKIIKHTRPNLPINKVCQVFHTNDLLEIGFLSKQCRNDIKGSCIMCDYGCAQGTQKNEVYISEMHQILNEYEGKFKCLLLCTNGSFMDEYQIPNNLFRTILQDVNLYPIPEIEIETHYQSVTKEKLELIKYLCPNKKVKIEMGLETINEILHEYVIMKQISLKKYKDTISLVKSFHFEIDLNIMVGMPFLEPKEQFEDALKTINWTFEHNCYPVIFPINIKPYTLLWHMYQVKQYRPISHWLIIFLLTKIPTEKLERVTIAWYGNREEVYIGKKVRAVFPESCHECHQALMSFYQNFNTATQGKKRKELINLLLSKTKCGCQEKLQYQLNKPQILTFEEKYNLYAEYLTHNFQT